MKNLFTLLLIAVSMAAFSQPNKAKIDSVRWKDQQLIQYPGGTVQGGLLDSRGNFVIRNNSSTGFRNTLLGYNNTAGGTGNFMTGNNGVIESGVIGATMNATDGITHTGADYSDNGGDANELWGEGGFSRGFGNDNHGIYGSTFGNDNYMARSVSSFMSAQRSSSYGDRAFTVGRAINSRGNDNYTFGTGKDNTMDSLQSTVPNSFNVGFNQQMKFRVFRDRPTLFSGMAGDWRGNPVVVNIEQEHNGGYSMLFTNKAASAVTGIDFVGTIHYLGNDGDFWTEAKYSRFGNYESSEIGLNPKLKLITINPAVNGAGTVSLWKNINFDAYPSTRNDGKTSKAFYTDDKGNVKLGTIDLAGLAAGTAAEGSVLQIVGGVPTWVPQSAIAAKQQQKTEQVPGGKYMVMTTTGQLLYLIQVK